MKRIILIILFSSIRILDGVAQTFVQNPSFEGIPAFNSTPPLWQVCFPTPDVQPGIFCVSLSPVNGVSYIGLASNSNSLAPERIGQKLFDTLKSGVLYKFNINLASIGQSNNCTGVLPHNVMFELWGGNSMCSLTKLLWQSPIVLATDTTWKTYKALFIPDADYPFIVIKAFRNPTPLPGYLLIDNISDFKIVNPEIWFSSPSQNSNQTCTFNITGKTDSIPSSIQLTGKFIGVPLTATFNSSDTSWQASITYPPLFTSIDTIIAIGTFANSYIARDTLIINVSTMAGFTADSFCLWDSTVFTDTSTALSGNIIERKWYFGDGNSLTKLSSGILKHHYQNPSVYNVSLSVLTDQGCTDSISKQVTITDCNSGKNIFIPNLITPNGDKINDAFEINIKSIIHLEIYNRWGQIVYKNNDYKNNWAGETDDIYYYFIETEGKKYKGWLHIIK